MKMYENMKNKDSPSELISTYFKQVVFTSSGGTKWLFG